MRPGAVLGSDEDRLTRQAERENRRHGSLDKIDGYYCQICFNKGYTVRVKDGEIVQSTCKCDKVRRGLANLRKSGLADVTSKYTFASFEAKEDWQRELLEKAKKYIDYVSKGACNWLFVAGNSGAGKTHICSAVAVQLLRQYKEVKYMLWKDESRALKATINDKDCNIDFYKRVEVLYIDDLFKIGRAARGESPFPSGADASLAFEILNHRAVNNKITIISTEYTIEDIVQIDEAIAGRINEAAGPFVFNIGKDERKNYRLYGGKT